MDNWRLLIQGLLTRPVHDEINKIKKVFSHCSCLSVATPTFLAEMVIVHSTHDFSIDQKNKVSFKRDDFDLMHHTGSPFCFQILYHSDDHISLFFSCIDVAMRFSSLFQRIGSVNDRFNRPGFNQLGEGM